jgi:hypothetical protein
MQCHLHPSDTAVRVSWTLYKEIRTGELDDRNEIRKRKYNKCGVYSVEYIKTRNRRREKEKVEE